MSLSSSTTSISPGSGESVRMVQDSSDSAKLQGTMPSPNPLSQLGSQRLTMAGAAQSASITSGTRLIRIAAEGGDLRFTCSGSAGSTSPGFLPQNSVEWLENPGSLSIYGLGGTFANMLYFGTLI